MSQLELLEKADFLALVRRITPPNYHEPLEANPNSGWEIHEGQAAVFERASQAVLYSQADWYILSARGGVRATGEVSFSRAAAGAGAITLKAGTRVATADGLIFETRDDAVFGALALGPITVDATAEGFGYEYSVLAGFISEIAQVGDGSGDDTTITVTNSAAFTLGHPKALDALGWDRNVLRLPGEIDADYRTRIRTLPDTVCPGAIDRLLERYSSRYGVEFLWSETHDEDNDSFWDDDLYADDDTDGVLDSLVTHRGAFFVLVPDVGEVYDSENFWDDDLYPDDASYYDDFDAAKAAIASGLLSILDKIKAGGIAIIVVQDNAPAGSPSIYDNFTDDLI